MQVEAARPLRCFWWRRCRVEWDEGTPLLLEWLRDGKVIDFSDPAFGNRFSLLPNNALVVSAVHLQDAGMYTCRASTPFDSISAAATLTVRRGNGGRGREVLGGG